MFKLFKLPKKVKEIENELLEVRNVIRTVINSTQELLYNIQTTATTCALIIETLEEKGIELKGKEDSNLLH